MTGCDTCCPDSAKRSSRAAVSPNAPSKSVIRRPARDSQNVTRCDQATGSGAAARSAPATPHRRRCSIVLMLVVLARGLRCETSVRGSISTQPTPCHASSAAAASPAGPPPTTSTGVRSIRA